MMATNITFTHMESAGGNPGYVFIIEHALPDHHVKEQTVSTRQKLAGS